MQRTRASLIALALVAALATVVVAAGRMFPGPPTDASPRINTPNDPDYDRAEPDDEDGDFVPATSVFNEDNNLFGFAEFDHQPLTVTLRFGTDVFQSTNTFRRLTNKLKFP